MNPENIFSQLIEAWPGGACLINEKSAVQHSNETLNRWLGLNTEEIHNTQAEQFFNLEEPILTSRLSKGSLVRNHGAELEIELTSIPLLFEGKTSHLLFIHDITDRQRAERERKVLTHRLLEIQEEERKEISSLLHDQLGQLLTLIRLELQSIVPKDEVSKHHIESCTSHTLSLLETVRGLARSLRPSILDDMPIEDALEDLVDEFNRSMEADFIFTVQGTPTLELDRDKQTSIYRILQESLQNAARHSGASQVKTLYTVSDDGITLSVIDNGAGFAHSSSNSPHESIGLIGIRERLARGGGFLIISSHAGEGSRLDAFMPYENDR